MATSTSSGITHKRIPLVLNKNYKRDGFKSYAYLLQKFNIGPTKPGPFYTVQRAHHQGKFGRFVGGKTTMQKVLLKRTTDGPVSRVAASGGASGGTSGGASGSDGGDGGLVPATDIQHDSEYLCPVSIGTPPQQLMLDFDTGSADLWVWSSQLPSNIKSQYGSQHTIFDSSKSSTFKNSQGSTWQIQYGDSSTAQGTVGTDTVVIGGISVEGQGIELASKLSTQFAQGAGDGLLGLAYGSINTVKPEPVPTPVENMITQKDIPQNAELFTAHLSSDRDANTTEGQNFYTFGFIDQDVLKANNTAASDIHYTPIDNSQGFWSFDSTSATVNGTKVALSGNTAIADTGTTLALVSDEVVDAIYKAIPGAKYDDNQQGYLFPSSTSADQLPVVQFDVGGKLFTIQKEDLAYADAGNNMVYGGIQSRGDMTFDILGDTFLKSVYAIFDQGNKRFGAVQRTSNTDPATTTTSSGAAGQS